jgi:SPP1 gp7 family putative phage head morphogenesis protein
MIDTDSARALLALINEVLSERIDKARGFTRADLERFKSTAVKWFRSLRSALPAEIRDVSDIETAYYDWLNKGKELFAAEYMRLGERVRGSVRPAPAAKKKRKARIQRLAANYIRENRPRIAQVRRSQPASIVYKGRDKAITLVVTKLESWEKYSRLAASRVTSIAETTRLALQGIIAEGLLNGWTGREIASLVKVSVGVNDRQARAIARLRDELIADGEPESEVRRSVEAYADDSLLYRAEMIARTESRYVLSEAYLDDIEGAGYSQAKYLALEGACDECDSYDGEVFDISDAEGLIPVHPNCRCQWLAAE